LSFVDFDGLHMCRRWKRLILQSKCLVLKQTLNGDRKRGGPKLRWCDELEEEVTQVGCRNWRINAQSRQK